MTNDLLPDEIYAYWAHGGKWSEQASLPNVTKYIRADLVSTPNKPAEVDLERLAENIVMHHDNSEYRDMTDGERFSVKYALTYLSANGHLATGKGGGDSAVADSIEYLRNYFNPTGRVYGGETTYIGAQDALNNIEKHLSDVMVDIDAETLQDAAEMTVPQMEKALDACRTWDTPGLVNEVARDIMAEAYLHSRREEQPAAPTQIDAGELEVVTQILNQARCHEKRTVGNHELAKRILTGLGIKND